MDRDSRSPLIALKICKSQADSAYQIFIVILTYSYEIMLDCWKADPELCPSFSLLKHKAEEMIQHGKQEYPYLDFNLNDYLPYCNLRLASVTTSTENILDELKQLSEDDEKESSESEVGEETKKEKEVEKETDM